MQRFFLLSRRVAWLLLAAGGVLPPAVAAEAGSTPKPPATSSADPAAISAADAKSIRAVIQSQLDAFAADDAGVAFALAAPKIRQMFGDADRFIAMVRSSYPVVYRHATVDFMAPRRIDGDITQAVRMTDGRGGLWLAVYQLERQPDKSWRISGCQVAEIEGRVA